MSFFFRNVPDIGNILFFKNNNTGVEKAVAINDKDGSLFLIDCSDTPTDSVDIPLIPFDEEGEDIFVVDVMDYEELSSPYSTVSANRLDPSLYSILVADPNQIRESQDVAYLIENEIINTIFIDVSDYNYLRLTL